METFPIAQEMKAHATEASQLLKALANENRLMILCSLAQGELNVSQLNDRLDLSQSALSQHLACERSHREQPASTYSSPGSAHLQTTAAFGRHLQPEQARGAAEHGRLPHRDRWRVLLT